MMGRADQYFVQQQLREINLEESTFAQCPTLLGAQPESPEHEQFDSGWEDAEEEDGKTTSALDAKLDASTGEEMDASGHPAWMSSAERCHRRNRAMHREHTQVQREFRRPKNRCLSFPLFWETTKEDAISYRDWCSEIEDALEHGHNAAKVKESMFASLEGMARDNAKMIDENGDLHVTCILDGWDSLYGVSMTFQSLNAALCGLQQRQMESACAYYNRMAQISVILRERHSNHYRLGELVRMSKDCFYVGLLPNNCPMVVHLKDQPHTTPLDLLKALLEQEENDALTRTQYPPSTSSRTSQPSKPTERYHRQPPAEKRNDGYTVHPAQLDTDPTEAAPKADSVPLTDTLDALETWYNDRFLIGLCQAAEVSELRHGHCFNCQKEGHHWHQCKEPLSILDSVHTWVLVDNGTRVNSVTPAFIHQHKLGVHPISELDHTLNPFRDRIPLVGLGGGWAEPLGFTLMRVQIEDMPHYDEQQVVFILDDPSRFFRQDSGHPGYPYYQQGHANYEGDGDA